MAPARTYEIQIINATGLELLMQLGGLQQGEWRDDSRPPFTISPDRESIADFASESGESTMGTKGRVIYTSGGRDFTVDWDNPIDGPATSSVSCPSGYSESKVDVVGNDATVLVIFSKS
jgi:hypothetical protein